MVRYRTVVAILVAALLAVLHATTAIAERQNFPGSSLPASAVDDVDHAAPAAPDESPGENSSASAVNGLNAKLAALARAKGIDKNPRVKQAIAMLTERVLADAYKVDFMQGISPSESEISNYYKNHTNDYDLYSLSHILVKFERDPSKLPHEEAEKVENKALHQAQEIRSRIVAGADFHELAAALSDDANSRADGGRVPETMARYLAPAFKSPVLLTKKGEVTPPIKSAFGYDLIKVEEMIPGTIARNRADIINDIREVKLEEKEDSLISSK